MYFGCSRFFIYDTGLQFIAHQPTMEEGRTADNKTVKDLLGEHFRLKLFICGNYYYYFYFYYVEVRIHLNVKL